MDTVSYCCIWKGGLVLYSYSTGDHEIDNLAALCLEMIPPYHQWYFETTGRKTYGFFMDDGFVYFAIACENLGNPVVLRFLHKLRNEFRRIVKRGSSTRSVSALDSACLQEQLFPVVGRLVASLEWPDENSSGELLNASPCNNNNANGKIEAGASTKAPLLGKPSTKQQKKKLKDHATINIEAEEERRGVRIESRSLDSNDQGTLQMDLASSRIKPSSQNLQKKWCRQVRIVLAIDAGICILLFIIWLVIWLVTERNSS